LPQSATMTTPVAESTATPHGEKNPALVPGPSANEAVALPASVKTTPGVVGAEAQLEEERLSAAADPLGAGAPQDNMMAELASEDAAHLNHALAVKAALPVGKTPKRELPTSGRVAR
jgi:hypothetical protein